MEGKIDTLKMVRKIRDEISEKIDNKSTEEILKFYEEQLKEVRAKKESNSKVKLPD